MTLGQIVVQNWPEQWAGCHCSTSRSNIQWLQASLPIRQSGLGIRQVHLLALPAFLALAASTSDLQTHIFLSAACPSDTFFENYLAAWQNAHDSPSLPSALRDKQTFWDQPGIQSARTQVEAHYSEPQQTARFLAAATPHSGDWLLALPISSCGLRLWRHSPCGSRSASWLQHLCSPYMSLWIVGRHSRPSWLDL